MIICNRPDPPYESDSDNDRFFLHTGRTGPIEGRTRGPGGPKNGWKLVPVRGVGLGGVWRLMANAIKKFHILFLVLPLGRLSKTT